MAKVKSIVVVLFLSLLLCLSSQVNFAYAKRHKLLAGYSDSNEFLANLTSCGPSPRIGTPRSKSSKGKGP